MANEVATTNSFNLITLNDFSEAIAEEMDGLGTIPLDRVKIPSGGGIAFEVSGDDEDNPESASELVGIILHHHAVNAYWRNKFSGANDKPDCASMDGKTGVDQETGEMKSCADCPCNQFGSDDDGRGKACKNIHRIYFLRSDNPVPIIISLPPTSLKSMRDYIGKRILVKGMRCYDALTKITLKKEKNAAGIVYSRVVFTFVEKLSEEARAQAKLVADSMKQMDKNFDVDEDDYSTGAPVTDKDGFMNVPEGSEEQMPFN